MKNQPSVDVIIPTYNGLPYLREAVSSVLAQTHRNLMLYVIDDGSTDNGRTEKYIKSLNDDRVRYFRKQNGGQATARNYGIKASDSPYVTFLDSDDIWEPDKLKLQIGYLDSHPEFGMVYGYHTLINEREEEVGKINYAREGHLFNYLLGGNRISGSGSMAMIKRTVLDEIGLFREDFLIGEDWEMWLRISKKYQIGCVHRYIAKLRALPEGMQKDYLKMARGLEYMLPIMLDELRPSLRGRARLSAVCLYEASINYFLGGERAKARSTLFRALLYNPSRLITRRDMMPIYVRALLGNEALRKFRRILSPAYRQREIEHQKEQRMKAAGKK